MFDYIIVGAGSAGCVLARRLSEDPDTTVLLLEAGGPDLKRETRIPAAWPFLFKGDCDWAYETEAQSALNQRKLYWPRGKTLGGTSSMNAMIYIRGNRHDYDQWHALGNRGWGFDDVLPYFKKAQHQERGASEHHGVGGPLNVADLRYVNPLTTVFLRGAGEAGFPLNRDFNGERQEGAGLFQVTQRRGERHSTATAYLKPARRRANLTVYTHAHVTRVLMQPSRATGVACLYRGRLVQIAARREVILCGGTVNSPQLLMLSGIGPAAHLQDVGIPVTVDLPGVGRNLQDHLLASVICECTQPLSLINAANAGSFFRYVLLRRGPLASNIGEAGLFTKTTPHSSRPDLQLMFAPNYSMAHGFGNPPGHGFTLGVCRLRPLSRGHITLLDSDPLRPPAIQPNYLAHPDDLRTLIAGIRIARRITQSPAFDPVRGAEVWPGSDVHSDEEIAEFIRATAETLYHPVGTCKMGSDPLAVVDARLRVRGVGGLRVADASIMPTIISGNTNAPTIMIAEKAADMIREDAA